MIVFTPDHYLLSNSEHMLDHSKFCDLIIKMPMIIILLIVEDVYC